MFCFVIQNQKKVSPTVTFTETGPVISSTAEIKEEECLTSKAVEDENRIPIVTNDAMDLGKMAVNEVKRDTLAWDQTYRYFKHQKVTSGNKDLIRQQVTKAGKTFVVRSLNING